MYEKRQYNGLEMKNKWKIANVLRQDNITTANAWRSEPVGSNEN